MRGMTSARLSTPVILLSHSKGFDYQTHCTPYLIGMFPRMGLKANQRVNIYGMMEDRGGRNAGAWYHFDDGSKRYFTNN